MNPNESDSKKQNGCCICKNNPCRCCRCGKICKCDKCNGYKCTGECKCNSCGCSSSNGQSNSTNHH